MLPEELKTRLYTMIAQSDHTPEKAIDVMFALQDHYGYMTDEAMEEAAELLGMSTLELEEIATFYDFIYREPVGKYVIHVCDSSICWMHGHESVMQYISSKLNVTLGGMTADGLFSLLPVVCIGYCDRAPAMLINRKVYGQLTREKIDRIFDKLMNEGQFDGSHE
jgi:NADH-quinone oxidoreductase subunit E